jgi:hypothetical protein
MGRESVHRVHGGPDVLEQLIKNDALPSIAFFVADIAGAKAVSQEAECGSPSRTRALGLADAARR